MQNVHRIFKNTAQNSPTHAISSEEFFSVEGRIPLPRFLSRWIPLFADNQAWIRPCVPPEFQLRQLSLPPTAFKGKTTPEFCATFVLFCAVYAEFCAMLFVADSDIMPCVHCCILVGLIAYVRSIRGVAQNSAYTAQNSAKVAQNSQCFRYLKIPREY